MSLLTFAGAPFGSESERRRNWPWFHAPMWSKNWRPIAQYGVAALFPVFLLLLYTRWHLHRYFTDRIFGRGFSPDEALVLVIGILLGWLVIAPLERRGALRDLQIRARYAVLIAFPFVAGWAYHLAQWQVDQDSLIDDLLLFLCSVAASFGAALSGPFRRMLDRIDITDADHRRGFRAAPATALSHDLGHAQLVNRPDTSLAVNTSLAACRQAVVGIQCLTPGVWPCDCRHCRPLRLVCDDLSPAAQDDPQAGLPGGAPK